MWGQPLAMDVPHHGMWSAKQERQKSTGEHSEVHLRIRGIHYKVPLTNSAKHPLICHRRSKITRTLTEKQIMAVDIEACKTSNWIIWWLDCENCWEVWENTASFADKRGQTTWDNKWLVCLSSDFQMQSTVIILSIPEWVKAFRRFVSQRGYAGLIMSGNGKNFLGAKEAMKLERNYQPDNEHIRLQT